MRTFTLIDKDGNTYDITTKNNLFFFGVEGLGYEQNTSYQRIYDRYSLLDSYYSQTRITGTVRFWDTDNLSAEASYFAFAQFCQNAPIKMQYNPGHGTFYRDGNISKITRSDGVNKSLEIKIEFESNTPWYKVGKVYNNGVIEGGKVYNYEYDYTYSNSVQNSVTIDSDSYISSPAKFIIYGPAVNPSWNHYVNGELKCSGAITGTVLNNCKLVVDTTTTPYSIKEYDLANNLVQDMYQLSDFSKDRFIRVENGRNTISVTEDNASILNIGLEAQIEYATV